MLNNYLFQKVVNFVGKSISIFLFFLCAIIILVEILNSAFYFSQILILVLMFACSWNVFNLSKATLLIETISISLLLSFLVIFDSLLKTKELVENEVEKNLIIFFNIIEEFSNIETLIVHIKSNIMFLLIYIPLILSFYFLRFKVNLQKNI